MLTNINSAGAKLHSPKQPPRPPGVDGCQPRVRLVVVLNAEVGKAPGDAQALVSTTAGLGAAVPLVGWEEIDALVIVIVKMAHVPLPVGTAEVC